MQHFGCRFLKVVGCTSTQQTDGAEQPRLRIVHLQRKELVGEGEHQVGEGTEAGVVHLGSVERESI